MTLKPFLRKVTFFWLGFLALSNTGGYILKDAIDTLYIPELLVLIFVPFIYKELHYGYRSIKRGLLSSPLLILTFLFLLCLTYVGFLESNSINDTLAVSRVFFIIILFSYISKNLEYISTEKILYICIGVLSGDAFSALFLKGMAPILLGNTSGIENEPENFNIIPIFLATTLSLLKKKKLTFLYVISLLFVATIISTYRVIPFISIYSFFAAIVYVTFRVRANKKVSSIVKDRIYGLAVVVVVSTSFVYIYQNLELPKWRYYRLVTRTIPLLGMDLAQAAPGRMAVLAELPSAVSEHLFPNGFATTSEYIEDVNGETRIMRGYHKDFPIIFFSYTFGLPISLLLIVATLMKGFMFSLKKTIEKKLAREIDIASLLFFPLAIFLLFFNGRFLFFPLSEGMLFGLLVGRWFR